VNSTARLMHLAVLLAAASGCVFHAERNAPGRVDVHLAPKQIQCHQVEEPEDPGEHVLTLSTGAHLGGGVGIGRPGGTAGIYQLGVEASLHYGVRPRSHRDDPPLFPLMTDKYYPRRSVALNVGWHLLEHGLDGPELGAGYLELQLYARDAYASGIAAGWVYDPQEEHHGPQFTLFSLGVFYVRVTYLIDRGTDLLFGLLFKVPATWFWSR
jgi:hypothetical protein